MKKIHDSIAPYQLQKDNIIIAIYESLGKSVAPDNIRQIIKYVVYDIAEKNAIFEFKMFDILANKIIIMPYIKENCYPKKKLKHGASKYRLFLINGAIMDFYQDRVKANYLKGIGMKSSYLFSRYIIRNTEFVNSQLFLDKQEDIIMGNILDTLQMGEI